METPGTSLPLADKTNAFRMIDVGEKLTTRRRALAEGMISMSPATLERIRIGKMPKGDVLKLAEVAGIMAAKKTSDLLPLCHPLPLDSVRVCCEILSPDRVRVTCEAFATAKTGVEMEALSGVNGALLSIYDLTKGVDPALTISGIFLRIKEGGKSGRWVHPKIEGEENHHHFQKNNADSKYLSGIHSAVLTVSDRCSRGESQDQSGPLLVSLLKEQGSHVVDHSCVADEKEIITSRVLDLVRELKIELVFITGGTGLSARDVTPEALEPIWTKKIPGFGELLRKEGSLKTPHAYLSRSQAGLIDQSLVILLPGSSKAVVEGFESLVSLIPHALEIARGKKILKGEHS